MENTKMVQFDGSKELMEELGVKSDKPDQPKIANYWFIDGDNETRIFIGDLLIIKEGTITMINGVSTDGLEIHNLQEKKDLEA